MRTINGFLWLLAGVLAFAQAVAADTGTYEILDYQVTLLMQEDGTASAHYYQKWRVTGGGIPWITVGLANSSHEIAGEIGGNARSIKSANSGSWSGVRIDLDKNYQGGEEFEVEFTVIQRRLLYADEHGYRLDFIPGWYDRAKIGELTVRLGSFTELDKVQALGGARVLDSGEFEWHKANLQEGGRISVGAIFPEGYFPHEVELASADNRTEIIIILIAMILFILLLLLIVIVARRSQGGYGGGGAIFRGGAAHTAGTHASTCACACVACACACACAGGGAAGCDRKVTHTCPLCKACEKKDCPLRVAI